MFGGRSADPIKIVSVIIKKHAQNIKKQKKEKVSSPTSRCLIHDLRSSRFTFYHLLKEGLFLIEVIS